MEVPGKASRVGGPPRQERIGDLRPLCVSEGFESDPQTQGCGDLCQRAEGRVRLPGSEEAPDCRGLDLDGTSTLGLGQTCRFTGAGFEPTVRLAKDRMLVRRPV